MGKTRRGHKEFSKEQELRYENHKLRRQISSLRKQLARLDLDRHDYVKTIVDEHLAQEEQETTEKMLHRLKEEWRCKECGIGYLEINLYNKPDDVYYYRKCSSCPHRTKSQVYSPSVRGIMKEPKPKK